MAKKKAAKAGKKLELRFIEDPGHGWAEAPETLCKSLGLDEYSAWRNGMRYFEEDCEMEVLEKKLKKAGYAPKFVECYVDDFDAWLDSNEWPGIPNIPEMSDG
jgi:hypothetical protein